MDYLVVGIVVLVFLNVFVSIYLFKRADLDRFQKVAQATIVWLIPFIGAIGLWLLSRSHDSDNKPSGGSFGGGSQDGIGVSSSGD
jgi:hypothetical protein